MIKYLEIYLERGGGAHFGGHVWQLCERSDEEEAGLPVQRQQWVIQ